MEEERLGRAVIYQEYCDLLGSVKEAVILGQMIYWQQRCKDFDLYQKEMNKRNLEHGLNEQPLTGGWVYKTNEELSNEIRICKADAIGTGLNKLVELGYLYKRKNPLYKRDRTNQYLVDIFKVSEDLKKINLSIPNYKFTIPTKSVSINSLSVSEPIISGAIPETTTKTTTKTTTNNIYSSFDFFSEETKTTFIEFVEQRKKKEKFVSDKAINLLYGTLVRVSVSPEKQQLVIEKSLVNGWKTFYPLKNEDIAVKQNDVGFEKPEKEALLSFVRENSYKDSIADEAWIYFENTNWLDYRGNKITDWKRVVMDKYFKEWNKYKQPTTAEEFTVEASALGRGGMKRKYGEDGFYNIRMMPGFYYG